MRAQITLIDLILVPIVAVILSIISMVFLSTASSNLLEGVYLQPVKLSCNFLASTIFSNYYPHFSVIYLDPPYIQNYYKNLYYKNVSFNSSNFVYSFNVYLGKLVSGNLYNQLIDFLYPVNYSYFKLYKLYNSLSIAFLNASVYLLPFYPPNSSSQYIYACNIPVYSPVKNESSIFEGIVEIK
ncbi:MAG: hypothetical protein QXX36_01000 [Candidatus Rehaiarchaeum fermentans]|nr:hypothetical protein [Candidatus Rehaiarchaeum fermentans]MCW1302192.1 hypothetical protein [Candidatus Rehaiarchaeum fermentans]